MKQYPKIRYPGDEETADLFDAGEVYIQEKLDGANFRFAYDENEGIRFGSKNTEGDSLAREQFAGPIAFINQSVGMGTLKKIQDDLGDVVFFGEAMIPHTISYDWDRTPGFVGYDIWSVDKEVFLECGQARELFDVLGLPYAPIVDRVSVDEWDEYEVEIPQSEFYEGPAEGVVFKNHTTGTYGKLVRDEFKEKSKQKFGASSKKALDDTELLVEEYVPPARVRSVAHQLVDNGEWDALQMEMMEDLPRAVIRDMADEEGGTIFMSESSTIDIGEFRSIVSGRCAGVLRQMIDRRARDSLQERSSVGGTHQ